MTYYPFAIDDSNNLPPASGEDAVAINAIIEAIKATEKKLGIAPAGVYASVRTRLDILEARINNPFASGPNVNNPFYIGGSPVSGVSIQAGFGDPQTNLTPAIPGSLFLREDGFNIQGLYSFRPDGYWHQIDTDPWTAAGDLSGNIYSQIVIGLQGYLVSNKPPTDGCALVWNAGISKWEPQIQSHRRHITSITNNYLVVSTDDIIVVKSLSTSITVTLPASPSIGEAYEIKDSTGNANTNHIIVFGNGNNIDGAVNVAISIAYGFLSVTFDGSSWSII